MGLYGQELVDKLNAVRIGCNEYPMVKGFRGWAQPDMVIDQIDTGKPYPIKGAWIQTANILGGQAARAKLHYTALKKLDFVAVVDLFHNPTTMALADIVLPAATFAEKDSFRSWWVPLGVMHKTIQVGQCKSDWEINIEMANRLNPNCKYKTVKELINDRLSVAGFTFGPAGGSGLSGHAAGGPLQPAVPPARKRIAARRRQTGFYHRDRKS